MIQGSNARHPGIRVETLDLPNACDTLERYLAEPATSSRIGDLIATADPSGWNNFHAPASCSTTPRRRRPPGRRGASRCRASLRSPPTR